MFAVITDTAGKTFGELFDKADHYSDHSPEIRHEQIISVTRIRSNASLL